MTLFDLILEHVKPPKFDDKAPFSMLATLIESNPFFGRTLTGRIYSGVAKNGMNFKAIDLDGKVVDQGRITKLQIFRGVDPVAVEEAKAGDIVKISGEVNRPGRYEIKDGETVQDLLFFAQDFSSYADKSSVTFSNTICETSSTVSCLKDIFCLYLIVSP